jgi:hypothetical protein
MNTSETPKTTVPDPENPIVRMGKGMNGLAVASMISGYVLGPLLLLGGIGWLLTDHYDNKMFVYLGVGLAFISTNILIIRRSSKLTNRPSK